MNAWNGQSRVPPLQRTAAVGMILIQSALLGHLLRPLPIPVTAMALAGWFAPQFGLARRLPVPASYMLIIFLYIFKYRFARNEFIAAGFIGTELAYEVASCCLTIQLLTLFMTQFLRRLPGWFLAVSAAGLVFSCDVRVSSEQRQLVMWLVALYFVCWGVFASTSRTSSSPLRTWLSLISFRTAIIGGVLIGSVFLGRLASTQFYRHENQLERVISEYLSPAESRASRDGFSGTGGLSDVSNWRLYRSDVVALRIDADFKPDYLRGRVFDIYENDRWEVEMERSQTVSPAAHLASWRPGHPGDYVFPLRRIMPASEETMTVWPLDLDTSANLFLPLDAVAVACDSRFLEINSGGTVRRPSADGSGSYSALIDRNVSFETDPVFPDHLQCPANVTQTVREVAEEICRNQTTAAAKIQAVETFFHENFVYGIGMRVPRGTFDRLAYFLTERPPAHCEYFATAAAMLLRLAGVPTRYVTGYVVTELSRVDGSWVVRHKDSHAWVEAYDSAQNRWVIVEATPAAGLPTSNPPSPWQQWVESTRGNWKRLGELFSRGGLWLVLSRVLQPVILVLLSIVLLRAAFRAGRRSQVSFGGGPPGTSPDLLKLTHERIRMDRFLARLGFARPAGETVLSFARRLERKAPLSHAGELAAWYRRYATLRFRAAELDSRSLEEICSQRRHLVRDTKRVG